MVERDLQEKNLGLILKNDGFQFTDTFIPCASGEISPFFVHAESVTKDGEAYFYAIQSLCSIVTEQIGRDKFNVISGGESRDWDFSNPLAVTLISPHSKIYKDGRMLGANVKGKRVLHVSDLNNQGSSPKDYWVPSIRNAKGTIEHYLSYVDRLERGVKVLEELRIKSYSVVPLDGWAWDKLLEWGKISNDIYRNIRERAEDQDAWAIKMLQSDKGLESLAKLLNGDKRSEEQAHDVMRFYETIDFTLFLKKNREVQDILNHR
ncbi:hypothetical protein HYT25_04140 [Candidatus Pacearchaeota archaeon]|nr:hypothetical protein [Candidatus Pacearchaeota archaeon]